VADYTAYKISVGESGSTYPNKYTNFLNISEDRAQEVENARGGESTLVANLANYMEYTLATNVTGGGFKCINMPNGATGSQDYCTVSQALSLVGSSSTATAITDLAPGSSLSANDILVVDAAGTGIEGRSTVYSLVPANSLANGNYNMNLSSSNRPTALPAGVAGMVISYADIGGHAGDPYKLTITANGSEKIMGTASDPLVVDDYPSCSFDLVYVDATFGWTMARLQR
jgi:hypothetical protein